MTMLRRNEQASLGCIRFGLGYQGWGVIASRGVFVFVRMSELIGLILVVL